MTTKSKIRRADILTPILESGASGPKMNLESPAAMQFAAYKSIEVDLGFVQDCISLLYYNFI